MKISQFKLLTILLCAGILINGCTKDDDQEPGPDNGTGIRPVTPDSKAHVTDLFEYKPAPGQFINTSAGNRAAAESILGKTGLVSLGAWGGYIVLGFDHTVVNQPEKADLLILGNASSVFSEPGVVMVMADDNENGRPDDTWYELSGSETGKEGYIRDYAVTYHRPGAPTDEIAWTDNRGNSGSVRRAPGRTQSYYPDELQEDSYTLKGTLLPDRNIDDSNPSFIKSIPFEFGYADNTPLGDKLDLSNAIDAAGRKVNLRGIDFVRIQTGLQFNMGWLGEQSTEVSGVIDLSLYQD